MNWYARLNIVTICFFAVIIVGISPIWQTGPDDKEQRKLVALADKMILAANRLSSIQDGNELALIDEFVPLAEYVVKTLGK